MSDLEVGKNTILVIEDSPTQALHLQVLLEQEGLEVLIANNGMTGLEIAKHRLPDLIILDLQMPEMDGFQVCEHLNADPQTADIPVILLTHHDEQESVVMGLQLGAMDFIPKDAFADAVLLETMRQMGLIVPHS